MARLSRRWAPGSTAPALFAGRGQPGFAGQGEHRHPRPARPPGRHPAGSSRDRASPGDAATGPAPPISPRPDRSCERSPPTARPQPARPPLDRSPQRGHADTTRYSSSPEECSFPDDGPDPRQVPSSQVRGTPRLFAQASDIHPDESTRSGLASVLGHGDSDLP